MKPAMKVWAATAVLLPGVLYAKAEAPIESKYDCIYEYTIAQEPIETYATVLQIGDGVTKFSDYASFAIDSLMASACPDADTLEQLKKKKLNSIYFFDTEVWQNIPAGCMTVMQEVVPTVMGYEEPLSAMEWTLDPDAASMEVCGYECFAATTTYGGRQWTAWFAPEIAVSAGPWKFNGLPGLVLAAYDTEGLHKFEAISLRAGHSLITAPDRASAHFSQRGKVVKRKAEAEAGGMNGIDMSMIESITVVGNSVGGRNVIINDIPLRERPNGYTPLELE